MSSQKQYAVNRKEIVMKKFRRIATMLLALSLALSIVVIPAAAADNVRGHKRYGTERI